MFSIGTFNVRDEVERKSCPEIFGILTFQGASRSKGTYLLAQWRNFGQKSGGYKISFPFPFPFPSPFSPSHSTRTDWTSVDSEHNNSRLEKISRYREYYFSRSRISGSWTARYLHDRLTTVDYCEASCWRPARE